MGRIAAIGELARVRALALAGALVYEIDDADSVLNAWQALPDDVVTVVLTPKAAARLASEPTARQGPIRVVMPS